jgi:hypothetical protein
MKHPVGVETKRIHDVFGANAAWWAIMVLALARGPT